MRLYPSGMFKRLWGKEVKKYPLMCLVSRLATRTEHEVYRSKNEWKDPVFQLCMYCKAFQFMEHQGKTWFRNEDWQEALQIVKIAMLELVEPHIPFPQIKIVDHCGKGGEKENA